MADRGLPQVIWQHRVADAQHSQQVAALTAALQIAESQAVDLRDDVAELEALAAGSAASSRRLLQGYTALAVNAATAGLGQLKCIACSVFSCNGGEEGVWELRGRSHPFVNMLS